MAKLMTIAEAWNKFDGFVPDLRNSNQEKWFPLFRYDAKNEKIYFVGSNNDTTLCYATSIFQFKTSDRALQFGYQFEQLWDQFLLNH